MPTVTDMTAQNWRVFSDPRFHLQFRYPETTSQGHAIDVKETTPGGAIRVHLTSRGSQEVYFEVTQYPNLSVKDGYEQLKQEVEKRFNANVSALTETSFVGLPASELSFEWNEGKRAVIFVIKDGTTYRILCAPSSKTNLQIRSTIEFL
jgi:hypothetical protein